MLSSSSSAGCHSQLYNSICSYLHNQNRAQPIIGLNSITEVLTYSQPALYFCDVCFLRITKPDIRNHIMGSIHRYNYIKSHHACGWRSYTDLTLLARPLMDIAKMVEKREGTGDVQVLCVDEVIYNKMTSLPVPDAFAQMKKIKNSNALHSLVHKSPSEVKGNETSLQESGNTDGTAQIPTLGYLHPTLCVSATTLRSPIAEGPLKPLSKCQEASTPRRLVDSPVSFRIPCLESSPAPAFIQHSNQDQPVILDPNQSLQRYVMPSENQCLTETRTITVVRPPRQWSPIRIAFQNDTMHVGEEDGNNVIHSFGDGYESHPVQTTPYEAQLQMPVSHMAGITSRHRLFINESSPDSPEPVRHVEITSVIKLIRTQMLKGVLEPAETHDSNQSHDEVNSQEPVDTNWQAHDNFEEENRFLFSQNPIAQSPLTQTQSPNDQVESTEDFPENYKGRKPLIGLQAVIKCQSVDGNPPPCCYLCRLCSMKLKKKKILSHLTSCDHQRNYLKALHPQLLPKKRKYCSTNEMLEDIALQLEKEDGRGQIKVMKLSACLISEALHKDYQWCMKMLNCGDDVGWRPDLLSLNKTTSPSKTLKRPAESLLPPSEKCPIKAPDGSPTHQMPKKVKKDHLKQAMNINKVKNPVFKVSLSLQEGPVVIERTSLRDTVTVAPEIEGQSHAPTLTDDDSTNTLSEVQTCNRGFPHAVHCESTQQYPDGDMLARTHTEVDSRMCEDQFMNPAQYAYSGQFDQSQVIQRVEPSLRPKDCGSVEVVAVTYADWPEHDWSFYNSEWIAMRQNRDGSDHPECGGYMQYW